MSLFTAHFPQDDEGRTVIGSPTRGCPSCGAVARKVAANGKAVLYHPATDCCEPQRLRLEGRRDTYREPARQLPPPIVPD